MGIGVSVLLIAVGAILRWAIHWSSADVSVQTAGLVLFLVGVVGLIISLAVFGPWGYRSRSRRTITDGAGRTIVNDEQVSDNPGAYPRY
ncbi:MAG: hypothetical protein JWM85_799 [Acidimicrobiaceae bacterium]|nr:hypothetical protein [Acidimicrobiaceae bacterium]